jgi:uncharacterized glyoxalase superfamily protein PhnB
MRLVQARFVTDDVAGLAGFYARLVGADVTLNDYYVEVPTAATAIGFSRHRFTENQAANCPATVILDFESDDVDAEYQRVASLGVTWLMPPTTQPWDSRSMMFTDPHGNLINVFSRPKP